MYGLMRWGGAVALAAAVVFSTPAAKAACDGAGAAPARRLMLLDVEQTGERLVSVGEDATVQTTDAQGRLLCIGPTPTRVVLTGLSFVDDKEGWAVGHDSTILHSADGGETWDKQYEEVGADPLFDVHFFDKNRGLAIGAYGLALQTDDGGKTWQELAIGEDDQHRYAVIPLSGSRAIVVGESTGISDDMTTLGAGIIYRTDDAGRTWQPLGSPYEGSYFGGVSLGGDEVLIFGLLGNSFYSPDAGSRWYRVDSRTDNSLIGGAFDPQTRTALLVGVEGTIRTYTPGRAAMTEQTYSGSRNDQLAAAEALSEGGFVVVGSAGLHFYRPAAAPGM